MGCRVSLMSVDLPEPETPVTRMSLPRGNSTSTCLRLLPVHPFKIRLLPLPLRRCLGISIFCCPFRYCAVMVSVWSISWGVPWKTTSPPLRPARGPISTIQSALRIISSSCSTTITVFPKSRSSLSERMSRSLSRWCRPMLGSSSI